MSDSLALLIARIDEAVQMPDPEAITLQVKRELQDAIRARTIALPDRFRRVRPEGYARRLLHRNDDLGYTAVVMTWGPGQRTPLHDHAGIWCVEGVVQGRMDVTQYEYHILANALDEPSITLHVYGGEMTTCHVFEPTADGRYMRRERALSY